MPPPPQRPLIMQAGAFATHANAQNLATRLKTGGFKTVFVQAGRAKGKTVYRVRIGPINTVPDFDRIAAALKLAGVHDARIALD